MAVRLSPLRASHPLPQGNNSIQFFIIYVPSQQPKGQLQTQHSLDKGKHSLDTGKTKMKGKHWLKKIIIINSINSVKIFSQSDKVNII
jgi:hypothetical protein